VIFSKGFNMKSVFLMTLVLFSTQAMANNLDQTVRRLNQELNPKVENGEGYTVDYRQDMSATWLNINFVKMDCKVRTTYALEKGQIIKTEGRSCFNQWIISPQSLFQVTCEDKSYKNLCIDKLAKEVTVDIIRQMIKSNISDLKVK
jgi:hypothetical protein